MKLGDYLSAQPDQLRVNRFRGKILGLTASGAMPQFRTNLNDECRLEELHWAEIVKAVLDPSVVTEFDLKSAVSRVFQVPGRLWLGGLAGVPTKTKFGRVVTRKSLIASLIVAWKDDPAVIAADVNTMLNPSTDLAMTKAMIAGRSLGNYAMWSTFDPTHSHAHPFSTFLNLPAKQVACCLGLRPPNRPGDLIKLEYEIPINIPRFIPTIANAYASTDWHDFFRPSCDLDNPLPYGLSRPTSYHKQGFECPEVVHEPISGNDLLNPLRVFLI